MLKKPKIFYGWWIVLAIFLISAYTAGIILYGFTAIFEPIVNEFGWSYAQVSVAASLRGLEAGLISPVVGFLIGRLGPRKLIFIGALIIGIGFLLFSRITSLWMFYLVFIIISLGLSTTSGVVPMTVVGNWFQKKVSTANALATCGSAFGGLLVPLVTKSIDIFQWRTTMIFLALGIFIVVLPVSLIIRHKPEEYGYLPDGDENVKPAQDKSLTTLRLTKSYIGVSKALRSRIFWHIALGFACHAIASVAVITHIMPYLSSLDIPKTTSSLAVGGIALVGILGRLIVGWLGDKYDKRLVVAAALSMTILSLLLFGYIANVGTLLVLPFVILFGIGFGGPIPMMAPLILDYFGRNKLGPILGLAMGVMMLGGMIGAPLTGWVYDSFRSYQGAWFAYSALVVAGLINLLLLPPVKSLTKT